MSLNLTDPAVSWLTNSVSAVLRLAINVTHHDEEQIHIPSFVLALRPTIKGEIKETIRSFPVSGIPCLRRDLLYSITVDMPLDFETLSILDYYRSQDADRDLNLHAHLSGVGILERGGTLSGSCGVSGEIRFNVSTNDWVRYTPRGRGVELIRDSKLKLDELMQKLACRNYDELVDELYKQHLGKELQPKPAEFVPKLQSEK